MQVFLFGINIQNTISSEQWPGGCLLQWLCIQCCLIAMEDLPKAGSTVCTSQHRVHRLMAADVLRTSQSSLTFLLTLGIGSLASTSSRIENICKRLSLFSLKMLVWLLLLCLWWCLILWRKEAAWKGMWAVWQWSWGPARIWGDLEKNEATLGSVFLTWPWKTHILHSSFVLELGRMAEVLLF